MSKVLCHCSVSSNLIETLSTSNTDSGPSRPSCQLKKRVESAPLLNSITDTMAMPVTRREEFFGLTKCMKSSEGRILTSLGRRCVIFFVLLIWREIIMTRKEIRKERVFRENSSLCIWEATFLPIIFLTVASGERKTTFCMLIQCIANFTKKRDERQIHSYYLCSNSSHFRLQFCRPCIQETSVLCITWDKLSLFINTSECWSTNSSRCIKKLERKTFSKERNDLHTNQTRRNTKVAKK